MLHSKAARVPISESDEPNDDTASIFKLEIPIYHFRNINISKF